MNSFSLESEFAASNEVCQIESRSLFDGLGIVVIRVKLGGPCDQGISANLATLGMSFIELKVGSSRVFTIYHPHGDSIDFSAILGPEVLVDSRCEWNHGWRCRNDSTKNEYCVDSGASANRCSDRSGLCGHFYVSWVPPTCNESKD